MPNSYVDHIDNDNSIIDLQDKEVREKMDMTTTSATGNPISIADLKSAQIALNPVIAFEPIQAGSGTPSPSNVRAISGYDKIEVLSGGLNLVDQTKCTHTGIATDAGQYDTSSKRLWTELVRVKPSTTYRATIVGQSSASEPLVFNRVICYGKGKEFIRRIEGAQVQSGVYTVGADVYYINLDIRTSALSTDISISNITSLMLTEGQPSVTYEPYHKTTDLSESLGQTVYGATWYPRTGVLKSKEKANYIVIDGNASWAEQTNGGNKRYYVPSGASNVNENSVEHICNMALIASGNNASQCYIVNDRFAIYSNGNVYLSGNIASDVTALKALLNTTPLQICYTVVDSAEKTIQLTPHEIALSQGYNYISTNGTSISMAYHNGEMASLADVSQLGETVNELGEYVNTINDNEYVDCNNCSTIASIFDTIKQGQALKSISYGVGYIGNSQNTNIKTLLGNPSIANYVDVYIKPIATATYVQLAEVFAIGTVNVQTPIKRKYIWTNQNIASQSAWETINYMT